MVKKRFPDGENALGSGALEDRPRGTVRQVIDVFAKSVAIGMAVAAPVGPVGILCIRRALAHGWAAGSVTGLGAAVADAIFAAVAVFGLGLAMSLIADQRGWFALAGGAVMLVIALRLFLAEPAGDAASLTLGDHTATLFGTFMLTITNPMTVLGFVGIFAGFGFTVAKSGLEPPVVMLGVFVGSMAWWCLLAALVSLATGWIGLRLLLVVNRLSGVVILGFAAGAFTLAAREFLS